MITANQKNKIMSKMLASSEGRKRFAASLTGPLRKYHDYGAIGRKALMIDELPDGAIPAYDIDPELPAYIVGELGDSVQTVVRASRLYVPMFDIASYPTVSFVHAKERRFDIISRIKKKAKDELTRAEDNKIFAVLKTAADANTTNANISIATASFGMDDMADAFANVESNGLRVDKVFMNPAQYKVFRTAGRDYLDFETQRELLRVGYMGLLWGASVFQSVEIPSGSIFCVSEPEYIGVLPIRIDITVIPADDPKAREFGWSIFENIGIAIHNSDYATQQILVTES